MNWQTLVGYNCASFSNFESGRQPITDSFLYKMYEVFEVDVEKYKSYNRILVVNEEEENYTKAYWKTKYYTL